MKLLQQLTVADWVSLSGIISIWFGILAIINNQPFTAILFFLTSFTIDILDGGLSRKMETSSKFGLQLDTIIDTLNYPIFNALFVYTFFFHRSVLGSVVAIIILVFSSLRLSRMATNGIQNENKGLKYYEGVVTPHISAAVILLFYYSYFVAPIDIGILSLIIVVLSVLMVSQIKTYKPANITWLLIFIAFFAAISLFEKY